jgi:hypothetical protein
MSTSTTKDSKKTGTKPQVAIGDLSAKGDVRGGGKANKKGDKVPPPTGGENTKGGF